MAEISGSQVRENLRTYILQNFLFSDDQSLLDDTFSFRDTRTIDSMGMVELISFIEEKYHIKVLDEDMVPEKLDSIDRLVEFVRQKQGVHSG